ncbi:MAG TPA: 2-oxo-4-hydroxy-4-carboxy-5-ureidoimidazoline decarboxylase [Jatrophihabitans sp.]
MGHPEDRPIAVAEFDVATAADAAAELVPCCASKRWVSSLVSGRPYVRLDRLMAASDGLLGRLDWPDVLIAVNAHPRIAELPAGERRSELWSRREQAGVAQLSGSDRAAFAAANQSYEERFGHLFLICATGLSAEQMLRALRSRLRNDPVAEREVVRGELIKIVRLRLAKAFR